MDRQAYKAFKKDSPVYFQQLLKDTGFTDEELFKELQTKKEEKSESAMFVSTIILLVVAGVVAAYGIIMSL